MKDLKKGKGGLVKPRSPSESKYGYRTRWKPMSMNKAFWKEVLEGRTIKRISFDKVGVSALHLDDGQVIYFQRIPQTFFIKD